MEFRDVSACRMEDHIKMSDKGRGKRANGKVMKQKKDLVMTAVTQANIY